MPKSQERTSDFSVQREVIPSHEKPAGKTYRIRCPALRVLKKKRNVGAVLFADFTWIEIEGAKRAVCLTQTALRYNIFNFGSPPVSSFHGIAGSIPSAFPASAAASPARPVPLAQAPAKARQTCR